MAKGILLFMSPFATMFVNAVCCKSICMWKKMLFKYHKQIYFVRRNNTSYVTRGTKGLQFIRVICSGVRAHSGGGA